MTLGFWRGKLQNKEKRFQNSGGLIFLKRNECAPFLYDVKGESATHFDRQAAYYSQQLSQLTKLSCEAVLAPNLILFWAIKTETASKILFQNFLQYFLKKCNSFKKKTLSNQLKDLKTELHVSSKTKQVV